MGAGRPFKYTPDQFDIAWQQYFQWCDDNPWYKNEAIKSGDFAGTIVKVPTARPYTEIGFCAFHNHGEHFLNQLSKYLDGKEDKSSKQLAYILTQARAKCRAQKFEGAAVGAFNANIIARDLGLVDKKDVTSDGKGFADFLMAVNTIEDGE
jgi:hypothetical protein